MGSESSDYRSLRAMSEFTGANPRIPFLKSQDSLGHIPGLFGENPRFHVGKSQDSLGRKISIFSGKFPKNFDFFRHCLLNSTFQAKIAHLQLLLGKLFYCM